VGASWQAISSSYDDEDNRQRLGGYALLGLRSRWAVTREVALSLKVDNLLDKAYARARYSYDDPSFLNNQDYREEGRVWMFGVTWTPDI
jgi:vitamin B12 transporter